MKKFIAKAFATVIIGAVSIVGLSACSSVDDNKEPVAQVDVRTGGIQKVLKKKQAMEAKQKDHKAAVMNARKAAVVKKMDEKASVRFVPTDLTISKV